MSNVQKLTYTIHFSPCPSKISVFSQPPKLEFFSATGLQTIKTFLPAMMERNSGHIVAISSVAGIVGTSRGYPWMQGRSQDLVSGGGHPFRGGPDPLFFASDPKSQGSPPYVLLATPGFRGGGGGGPGPPRPPLATPLPGCCLCIAVPLQARRASPTTPRPRYSVRKSFTLCGYRYRTCTHIEPRWPEVQGKVVRTGRLVSEEIRLQVKRRRVYGASVRPNLHTERPYSRSTHLQALEVASNLGLVGLMESQCQTQSLYRKSSFKIPPCSIPKPVGSKPPLPLEFGLVGLMESLDIELRNGDLGRDLAHHPRALLRQHGTLPGRLHPLPRHPTHSHPGAGLDWNYVWVVARGWGRGKIVWGK